MTLSTTAGSRATAAFVNELAALGGVKAAQQSVTSSTTLVNDTALFVALKANASYTFVLFVAYEGGTQGSSDLKTAFTVPASTTTFRACPAYLDTAGNAHIGNSILSGAGNSIIAGTNGGGTIRTLTITGAIITGGSSGNLQFQWAQNTSSATATIVHEGSSLTVNELT